MPAPSTPPPLLNPPALRFRTPQAFPCFGHLCPSRLSSDVVGRGKGEGRTQLFG